MGRLIMCKAAHAINIKLMNMKFRASLPLYIVFQVSKQVLMMNGNKIPSITRKVFTDNNIKFKNFGSESYVRAVHLLAPPWDRT